MVQRPSELDTACSLALLQEEVSEGESISPPRPHEPRYMRFSQKQPQFHHTTTPATPSARATDTRATEAARASNDEKMTALRNFRRAKGLCFKCGERWGREHTCPTIVQIHIVDELLALFSPEEITRVSSDDSQLEETETTCSISMHAFHDTAPQTTTVIQLQAHIGAHEVLILVDSRSSASFINTELANQVKGIHPLLKPC